MDKQEKQAAAHAAAGKESKEKAPEKRGPHQQQKVAPKKQHGEHFRGIVRIVGKDVNGELPLKIALTHIKGIGNNLASNLSRAIEKELGIPPSKEVGEIPEEQLAKIEEIAKSPEKHGILGYNLNRQKDVETGSGKHLLANDLTFALRQDLQSEVNTKSWRGWRHQLGQRVRGQKTRTTGRTGMSVGVLKKALKEQKAGAPATDSSKEKEKKK